MIRSFFLRLASSLLPVALFGFGLALSSMLVFGNPTLVKNAVRDSGFYDVLVDNVFLQNQKIVGTGLPVSDPGIRDAVSSAFTPQLLQTTGDDIIDGSYAWLKGETERPEFNVDLTSAKAQAAENVAAYVANKAAGLPVCTPAQAQQLQASGMNMYTLTCRPAQLSVQDIHTMVRGSLMTSNDFFTDAFVTASTVQDTNGQPLYERLSFIPTLYQWTIIGVYVLGGVAALSLAGVLLLARNRRSGVKRAAAVTLVTGISSGVLAVLLGFAGGFMGDGMAKIAGSTEALQVKLTDIVTALLDDVRYWWLRIAIIEVVLGIIALVWLRVTRQKALANSMDTVQTKTDSPAAGPTNDAVSSSAPVDTQAQKTQALSPPSPDVWKKPPLS